VPNGFERNWMRLCFTVAGFRIRFGAWPSRLRISLAVLENIERDLLTPTSVAKLKCKLDLVADGSEFVAEDETGRTLGYDEAEFADRAVERVEAWLGVTIDRAEGDGDGQRS
jgi:hypothetical protein